MARSTSPSPGNWKIALQHLRHESEETLPWIDALCISQSNNDENFHQIQLMKEIYRGAKDTCLWLGEAADDSDLAMDIVGSLDDENLDSAMNELSVQKLRVLAALQGRAWWRRIWVIQGNNELRTK